MPVPRSLIASRRHTATLVAILLGIATAGALLQHRVHSSGQLVARPESVLSLYISLAAAELALGWYVLIGIRRSGTPASDLLGGRLGDHRGIASDFLIATALWGIWFTLQSLWTHFAGSGQAASVQPLLARSITETVVWVILSVIAGIAEEFVFRGYLLRQLEALSGSAAVAVIGQAALFGVSHGYQGLDACLRITAFGILFGIVAKWRRGLRPGMIAHAMTDIIAGLR
jgi:uncharacterized protein